jgi:hypothetical protein
MGYQCFAEPRLKPFAVKVDYKNTWGKSLSRTFQIDVSQFQGMGGLGTVADDEIAQALSTVAKELQSWASRRLQVEVTTTAEVEEHNRKIRAEIGAKRSRKG